MGLGRIWVGVGVGVCFFGKFFSALEGRLEFGASGRKGGGGLRERENERERALGVAYRIGSAQAIYSPFWFPLSFDTGLVHNLWRTVRLRVL